METHNTILPQQQSTMCLSAKHCITNSCRWNRKQWFKKIKKKKKTATRCKCCMIMSSIKMSTHAQSNFPGQWKTWKHHHDGSICILGFVRSHLHLHPLQKTHLSIWCTVQYNIQIPRWDAAHTGASLSCQKWTTSHTAITKSTASIWKRGSLYPQGAE